MNPKYMCLENECNKRVWKPNSRCRSCAEPYKVYPSRKGKENPSYKDGRTLKKCRCKLCKISINYQTPLLGSGLCHSCSCIERYKNQQNHPMYGKKRPDVSLRMSGVKNIAYVHGRYLDLYPKNWNKVYKETIRKRDNYKCQLCDIKQATYYRKLDVHHIDYDKSNIKRNNLISLCHRCHMYTNFNRVYWKKRLKK
jgi:hypothetical protein